MQTSSAVGRIARENLILNILVIVAIIAAIAYLLHASAENQPQPMTLAINEIMVSNKTQLADEDGEFSDWIEIYNYGDEPISLKGFGLSDNENDPFAWVFPDVTINPKEFLIVWASGKDRSDLLGELHTNFKISKYGETILLTHENGTTIDKVTFGSIEEDLTIGRKPDGVGEWVLYEDITPGNANSVIVYEMPNSPPEVSHQRGFYTQPFLLELKTDVSDAVIRYTLDGSEPTKDSPVYTEPIEIKDRTDEPSRYANIQSTSFDWKPPKGKIFKATVVRARLFRGDVPISDAITHTYFVSPDMPRRYTVPVISLVTDPENLFDYEKGIYMLGKIFDEWRQKNPHGQPDGGTPANYNQRGFEWERPVHIEFFEPGGKLAFAQNAGLRTAGGWSRANRQKSLRLYARNEYDENNNTFNHEIFPGLVKSINNSEPVTEFKRFMLRNGGNDNNDWNGTLLRDALLQSLVKNTGLDTQAFRPAVVFINGEYWGLYNLRERYDERYIEAHYNVDPESVVILEGSGYLVAGQNGDEDHYRDMINYIRNHDLSNPVYYNYVKTLMDVENFMEYCIAEIYCGNTDWPSGNIKFWRVRTDQYKPQAEYGQDGRWRWLLYDTDFGFSIYDGPEGYKRNHLEFATKAGGTEYPNPDWSTFLLRSLLKNQEFRTNFINRFADHLNTIFSPEMVVSKIRELEKMLEPEIPEHIERWSSLGGSLSRWKQNVDALEVFAENRPTYVRQHINEYFGLGGEARVGIQILEPEGGYVMVNSVEIDGKRAPWQGMYFKGNPIQVKAVPKEGYRFDGWTGAIVSDQPYLELNLENDMLLMAKFTKE